ncbi:MAG: hypothetical protein DRH26_06980 [Deltaproteobacteria bacterium]|nr:MAG: hypothetical protein DRH26_06980 [Deltaproteobacteria bacterium]
MIFFIFSADFFGPIGGKTSVCHGSISGYTALWQGIILLYSKNPVFNSIFANRLEDFRVLC